MIICSKKWILKLTTGNLFVSYFQNIYVLNNAKACVRKNLSTKCSLDVQLFNLDIITIEKKLTSLRSSNFFNLDDILFIFLKNWALGLSDSLLILFNNTDHFPSLKNQFQYLIYKKRKCLKWQTCCSKHGLKYFIFL